MVNIKFINRSPLLATQISPIMWYLPINPTKAIYSVTTKNNSFGCF